MHVRAVHMYMYIIFTLWHNMYQDLLKLRRIMYLGITETETLHITACLYILRLSEEWNAMPPMTAGYPLYIDIVTSHNFMTHNMHLLSFH